MAEIPGLGELWEQTLGDPRVCIAVLDGPVDLSHPAFQGADLTQVSLEEVNSSSHVASDHGTHVASIIFGQHDSRVKGIAPRCRGVIVPIFDYDEGGSLVPSSEERLAKAIRVALRHGANIINISGGQFSPSGEAEGDLQAAVAECEGRAMIVAAAGNDGCDCLHVPGAMPSVLAVGAMDLQGEPLPFSNWGEAYREHGVLAPGEHILGASFGGQVAEHTGTSFATPIVSGVAALVLSSIIKTEPMPKPSALRGALLQSAIDCEIQPTSDCSKLLSGRLHVSGVLKALKRGPSEMHETAYTESTDVSAPQASAPSQPQFVQPQPVQPQPVQPPLGQIEASGQIDPSDCGCGGGKAQPVYAIGEISYDFTSLSRMNSLQQSLGILTSTGAQLQVQNPLDFARHLCGFTEYRLQAASGLLKEHATNDAGLFELTIESGEKLGETDGYLDDNDDYRRILLRGVKQRTRVDTHAPFGPWQPFLEDQALPIGFIDASTFFLRTAGAAPPDYAEYDFKNATWVLPRDIDHTRDDPPRVHPAHGYDAQAVVWKLRRGATNMYAIKPGGNYSEDAYDELAEFLLEGLGFSRDGLDIYYYDTPGGRQYWTANWDPSYNSDQYLEQRVDRYPDTQGRNLEKSQRVSIPGVTGGQVTIVSGETLTEIVPDMRGTHSWSFVNMHRLINDTILASTDAAVHESMHHIMSRFDDLIMHLDEVVRNRGLSPQDRALNYAATHLVNILPSLGSDLVVKKDGIVSTFELDGVGTPVKSSIGPPGSDCWEVSIAFFNPDNAFAARVIIAQAIDVSDIIPYRVEEPKKYRRR